MAAVPLVQRSVGREMLGFLRTGAGS